MSKAIKIKNGYAVGVRCGKSHSGNHRLAGGLRGWWECTGCAHQYSSREVAAAQAAAEAGKLGGEIGNGGIIAAKAAYDATERNDR